jgi:hypothetical protein
MNKAAIQDAFVRITTLMPRSRDAHLPTHVSNVPRNNTKS